MKAELRESAMKEVELLKHDVKTVLPHGELSQTTAALDEWRKAMQGISPQDKNEYIAAINANLESNKNCLDPSIYDMDLDKNRFVFQYDFLGKGKSLYASFDANGVDTFFAQERYGAFDVKKREANGVVTRYEAPKGETISEILKDR